MRIEELAQAVLDETLQRVRDGDQDGRARRVERADERAQRRRQQLDLVLARARLQTNVRLGHCLDDLKLPPKRRRRTFIHLQLSV